MSSVRSIPTADRISDLPESILCHILSFLPTKFAATTRVLSKSWKPVWLSLLILNFDDKEFNDFGIFRKFVYSTMFSMRDKNTSIQTFTLKLSNSCRFQQWEINRIFKFVMQRGVKNLNFNVSKRERCIKLPLSILGGKMLQVLRLENIKMLDFDQVDFPCLKTLHLNKVNFLSLKYFVKFLYGCPILEDLNTKSCTYHRKEFIYFMENFTVLPNLVKVRVCPSIDMENYHALPNLLRQSICNDMDMDILMTLVCKTGFFHAEQMRGMTWKALHMFHNLTHMKLSFDYGIWRRECHSLIGMLPHFPNLQHFDILVMRLKYPDEICICSECLMVPPNSTIAPECFSSHLKTFSIKGYAGSECEFKFVEYIMQHSKVLETMTVKSTRRKKNQMFMKLSSCTRSSTRCKLLFS